MENRVDGGRAAHGRTTRACAAQRPARARALALATRAEALCPSLFLLPKTEQGRREERECQTEDGEGRMRREEEGGKADTRVSARAAAIHSLSPASNSVAATCPPPRRARSLAHPPARLLPPSVVPKEGEEPFFLQLPREISWVQWSVARCVADILVCEQRAIH